MNVAEMAREVARHGDRGDVVLAHISPKEAALLEKYFGSDVNRKTGLRQFGFFSSIGGLLGFGGSSSSSSAGGNAYNELSGAVQPLLNTGKGLVNQYNSGQLTPADQISLNQYTTGADAALRQQYASAGLGNSSMLVNQQNNVAANATVLHQQLVDNYLKQALGAYGTALAPLGEAIGYQYNGNVQSQNALGGILGSILGNSSITSGIGSMFGGLFGGGAGAASSGGAGIASIGDGGSSLLDSGFSFAGGG